MVEYSVKNVAKHGMFIYFFYNSASCIEIRHSLTIHQQLTLTTQESNQRTIIVFGDYYFYFK